MSLPRLLILLLTLGTLIAFSPAGGFRFVNFDDTDYVTSNPMVIQGLTAGGIEWAFTTFHAGNWHPLTWISHMLDCSLFGLNPGAFHGVNVLFHAANVALLFTWLRRLTGKIWPSAFVAALFAWHPLHVESVAWISERKDVLSTFFALLALLSYTRYAQSIAGHQRPATSAGAVGLRLADRVSLYPALIFFALGLLAKPMLVTLPFVLLLLDQWPLQRIATDKRFVSELLRLAREKKFFFLLSAASCALTILAQQQAVVSLAKVPLSYRLENTPVAIVSYLGKFFWPVNLCAFYPMPETIPTIQFIFALTVLLGISVAAWCWRGSRPFFGIGWLWFLGTLIPVIGLVQVGGQAMADRYTYIPSIGLFIALVFLLAEFAERLQTPGIIRCGFCALILGACLLTMENQLGYWRDSESLFRRAAMVTPKNDIALVNLGVALNAQGRYEEALTVYRQAEATGSKRFQVFNNLGNVLRILGRHAESLAEYRQAIELNPSNATLHLAAANELAALGQFEASLEYFFKAAQLNPNDPIVHMDIGKVLFKTGRDARGLDEFSNALKLAPENFTTLATIAHYLAANENAVFRDGKNAIKLARQADEFSGHQQPMVLDILGMAFAEVSDFANATNCAQRALELAQAAKINSVEAIRQRLELYKNQQPWRESFLAPAAPGK